MHVIVFAVHLDKLCLKVGTHAGEHAAHIVQHIFREHLAAVFGTGAGRTFTFASQCRELTQLRAAADWLKAVPVHPLQQALRDLERAYRNWWEGRTCPPTPRRKGVNDSFRFPDPVSLAVKRTGKSSGRIKLPKLGWIRLRERNWREMPGEIRHVTISRRADQWFAAVQWEREIIAPTPSALPAVGIDLGIAAFATLSDGSIIAPANHGKQALRALRRAQRSR